MAEADCAVNAKLEDEETCRRLIETFSDNDKPTAEQAAQLTRRLLGCFRASDAIDPKMFATTLAAVFAGHAYVDGLAIVDPLRGLATTLKFLPSLAEVSAALQEQAFKRAQLVHNAQWMNEERRRRMIDSETPKLTPERRRELADWARGVAKTFGTNVPPPTLPKRPPTEREKALLAEWDRQAMEARNATWAGGGQS